MVGVGFKQFAQPDVLKAIGRDLLIKCVITIKSVKEGYYIDVHADQTDGTQEEMQVASCIKVALDTMINYLMSKGARGEMIESYDLEAVREIIATKTKQFQS